eukprot:3345829-Rhodomonas_salina.1
MSVTAGGVGIGKTDPSQALDVFGNINSSGTITAQDIVVTGSFTTVDTTVQVTDAMEITNNGTGPALVVKQTGVEDIATFYDDGNMIMILKDGGNVGIGTTNPSANLDYSSCGYKFKYRC